MEKIKSKDRKRARYATPEVRSRPISAERVFQGCGGIDFGKFRKPKR